jgi:protein involved in temperature-dependent protein secretion
LALLILGAQLVEHLFRVNAHRAEFIHVEQAPAVANASLAEKNRAAIELDDDSDQAAQGSKEAQCNARANDIHGALA